MDEDSGLADTGHVLDEKGVVWSVMLNLTDTHVGSNSYYSVQLIESDTGGTYNVTVRICDKNGRRDPEHCW